jgi:ubiquinone/menaquinone biosynthesis C-methylase UbiE
MSTFEAGIWRLDRWRQEVMNEAEIQVLASIRRAEINGEPADRETLEKGGDRYWKYLEDWSGAWQSLLHDGLIEGDADGYRLTAKGRPLAQQYYAQRPNHFWYYYQHFYAAAQASQAHSQLCERVFGQDLTQEGQADMKAIHGLMAHLQIAADERVLDLGCGAGGIAEYLSDQTGARVTGLDYAATAIAVASERTRARRERLDFVQGDINDLQFADGSFDKVISIDTIYWVADMDLALASIARLTAPGGRIAIFIADEGSGGASPGATQAQDTEVARSLQRLGLDYEIHDYSEEFLAFWPRLKQVLLELRDAFIAEGNEVIFESLMNDCDDYIPPGEAGRLRRYLYIVKI